MILHDAEQGTQAWYEARAGIPTASNFRRIVTPTGRLSASRETYLAELLAAYFLGVDIGEVYTEAMERGKVLEPDAFNDFAFFADVEPTKCGLVFQDESRMVACSPDGLVGDDSGLELKCPGAPTHLLYLARGGVPKDYIPQVQGCMFVTGRSSWWFMSYHPGLPPHIVHEGPDPKYQDALAEHVPTFVEEVIAGRKRLEAMGVRDALQRWEGG